MSVSDPVADMLTKLRNACMANLDNVRVTFSKLKLEIVNILKSEGYISDFKVEEGESFNSIFIDLKYDFNNNPVITGLKKISKPGRRVYSGYKTMPRVYNGHGTLIVSSSFGIITGKKASDSKVGGEIICSVW